MRRVSNKRRAINRRAEAFRDELRQRVVKCDFCLQKAAPAVLDVHEVVIGACRSLALDKTFATMTLHRSCHNQIERLTIPHQIAYFLRSRPEDVDMEAYYELTKRRWPSIDQILAFYEELP